MPVTPGHRGGEDVERFVSVCVAHAWSIYAKTINTAGDQL